MKILTKSRDGISPVYYIVVELSQADACWFLDQQALFAKTNWAAGQRPLLWATYEDKTCAFYDIATAAGPPQDYDPVIAAQKYAVLPAGWDPTYWRMEPTVTPTQIAGRPILPGGDTAEKTLADFVIAGSLAIVVLTDAGVSFHLLCNAQFVVAGPGPIAGSHVLPWSLIRQAVTGQLPHTLPTQPVA